jgi:hypothetical protein
MIISDLSYLEVVSEVPGIVGGARRNSIRVSQRTRVSVKGSGYSQITATNSVSIIASNDNF